MSDFTIIRTGIDDDIAFRVLRKYSICALNGLAPRSAPDFFHFGKITEMRDGVKIQINEFAFIYLWINLTKAAKKSFLKFYCHLF